MAWVKQMKKEEKIACRVCSKPLTLRGDAYLDSKGAICLKCKKLEKKVASTMAIAAILGADFRL